MDQFMAPAFRGRIDYHEPAVGISIRCFRCSYRVEIFRGY